MLMAHHNFVHTFTPVPKAMNIPDAKAAVEKELKKLETAAACQFDPGVREGGS